MINRKIKAESLPFLPKTPFSAIKSFGGAGGFLKKAPMPGFQGAAPLGILPT